MEASMEASTFPRKPLWKIPWKQWKLPWKRWKILLECWGSFHRRVVEASMSDQGYGRGGTPVFTGLFEPLARVTLYLKDENGLGSCFGAA